MKILDIEQNTPEWHELRKTKIGASDCPVIMGVSPHKTPLKLYREKMMDQKQFVTHQMQRGKNFEEAVRNRFSLQNKVFVTPIVAQHDEISWMIASLDGYFEMMGQPCVLEIKIPRREIYNDVVEGKIPVEYHWQIQHQLAVTGCSSAVLVVAKWSETSDGFKIEDIHESVIYADESMIVELKAKEASFWACIESFQEPQMSAGDYETRTDPTWLKEAQAYLEAKRALKAAEDLCESHRDKLIALSQGQSSVGGGVRLIRTLAKGPVKYSAIPELSGVDLEKYRGKPQDRWTIREE